MGKEDEKKVKGEEEQLKEEPQADAELEEKAKEAEPEEEVQKEPDVATLVEQLKEAQKELAEARMRAQADFENSKKRLERHYSEHLKFAAEQVMKDLIPTLDNLELALTYGAASDVCQDMLKGVAMTQKLLLDAVGRHGLSVVGKPGEAFDPALHEAMGVVSLPNAEPETVAQVLQSGYTLQGRLLRPAKVLVNKK